MGGRLRHSRLLRTVALALASGAMLHPWMSVGCSPTLQAPLRGPDGAGEDEGDLRLDHGYSLLMGVLGDETRVSEILGMKSASAGTEELLRAISAAATTAREDLEALLPETPPISVGSSGLPLLEIDARNRIANQETVGLLLSSGATFELRILLTQEKATGYVAALSEGLASADPNLARRDRLSGLSRRFLQLNAELRGRLAVKPD
jgi:hypothetical protein